MRLLLALSLICLYCTVLAAPNQSNSTVACPLTGLTSTVSTPIVAYCSEGSQSCCDTTTYVKLVAYVALQPGAETLSCKSQYLRAACGNCLPTAQQYITSNGTLVICKSLCTDLFNACQTNGLLSGQNVTATCGSLPVTNCFSSASKAILSLLVLLVTFATML
jgi:hypothetical protein